jgi:restriction system protein
MVKKKIKHDGGPDFTKYFVPIIEVLKDLGGSGKPKEITDKIIEVYEIPDDELEKRNKNGGSTVKNRIAWARYYLVKGGVLDSSKRAVWVLKADYLTHIDLERTNEYFRKVHEQFEESGEGKKDKEEENVLDREIEEIVDDESYREQVLNVLKELPPSGFEKICQRLLRESGFTQVVVTGKTGDGGIDGYGVLEVNPLMSFKVIRQKQKEVISITI